MGRRVGLRETKGYFDPPLRIVDIDSGPDSTGLGEITNVEGGKVDAVETDEKASEVGVITEVEPRLESGKVGSKLRLTVCSSATSSSSSGEDKEVIGIWKELGVLASETSTELSNGLGVGSVTKLTMRMASIKAGVVAKVKVKTAKVGQRMAKRGTKSMVVKQRVVQGLKPARESDKRKKNRKGSRLNLIVGISIWPIRTQLSSVRK